MSNLFNTLSSWSKKWSFGAMLLLMLSYSFVVNAQCNAGGCGDVNILHPNYPAYTVTYTGNGGFDVVGNAFYGGDQSYFYVVAGNTYEWSYCSADGGSLGSSGTSNDLVLTLKEVGGAIICFSDDYCDTRAPKIIWTASFSGTVRLLTHNFNCVDGHSTYSPATLVWRATAPVCETFTGTVAVVSQPSACNVFDGVIAATPNFPTVGSAVLWYSNNFTTNATSPQAGQSALHGNAAWSSTDGGRLNITPASNSQNGTLIVANPNAYNASSVNATFDLFIGGGGGADGFSVSYGGGITAGGGLEGSGNGIVITFDTYQNGGEYCLPQNTSGGATAIKLKYNGVNLACGLASPYVIRGTKQKVTLYIDNANKLYLTVGVNLVINGYDLTSSGYGSVNKSAWTWAFSAQTGGANDIHAVDNVVINANNQFEYSLNNVSFQTSPTFAGLGVGTYTVYMRNRSGAYCTTSYAIGSAILEAPFGTPSPAILNQWNVDVFKGDNFNTYYGYYTETNLSFNTATRWGTGSTPSAANNSSGLAYAGCTVPDDSHSYRYDRKGFPCRKYELSVIDHDDWISIYIDANGDGDATDPSDLIFNHNGCCHVSNNDYCPSSVNGLVWTGYLTSSSAIRIETREFTGGSYTNIQFVDVTPAVSLSVPTEGCQNSALNLSATAGYSVYQWTGNGINSTNTGNVNTNSATPLVTGTVTYSVTATDSYGCQVSKSENVNVTFPISPALHSKGQQ